MDQDTRERIKILNEKGILDISGAGFHTPTEFAAEHLFYVAWSGCYECNRLYSVKREFLDFYSVIWVADGQLEVQYEGKKILVKKDEIILLDFRKPHSYKCTSDRLFKWEMVFKGNESEAYYNLITEKWGHKFTMTGKLRETIKKLRQELDSSFPQDHNISIRIHAMFCNMISQNEVSVSPPVKEAMNYIYNHYGEQVQIGEIAEHVSLSRYYFTRLFRKETGRTPNEYLAEIRINFAREMLIEKILMVSEIAERCGFANTSHFTRFFREKTGQTPAAFRKSFNLMD